MAVDTHRADFDDALTDIERLRDCIAGQRAMQHNAEEYLRRPEGMTDKREWKDYAEQVPFFEATGRTVEGLTGMAFYDAPAIDLPKAMEAIIADVTMDGVPLVPFAKQLVTEVVSSGRVGVFVDHPPLDPAITNRKAEEAANSRPFVAAIANDRIFNWRSAKVRNARQLVEVRFYDSETVETGEFEAETRQLIRVLQLVGNDSTGWVYRQRVFELRKDEEQAEAWVENIERAVTPTIGKKPLDYIPFWLVNPNDLTDALAKPPLLGLANTNVAHFNTSAQLERVLSFVGSPQPYITGLSADNDVVLTVGSSEVWLIPSADAAVGYLSCPGDGVAPLVGRLEQFEQYMALLGARMLAADKKGVEAAETAAIHRQGEISVLASICDTVSAAVRGALQVMADWIGAGTLDSNSFRIDTGFFQSPMDPSQAAELVGVWQSGAIAYSDLLSAFKRGKLVDKDRTAEAIAADNQSGPIQPIMGGLTNSNGG